MEWIGYHYPPAWRFTPAAGIYGFAPGTRLPRPYLYPFLPRNRVRFLLSDGVRQRRKKKNPNCFGGLVLWQGNLGISALKVRKWTQNTNSKGLQAHRNNRGVFSILSDSNGCHTVSTFIIYLLWFLGQHPLNLGVFPRTVKKVNKPLVIVNNLWDSSYTVKHFQDRMKNRKELNDG